MDYYLEDKAFVQVLDGIVPRPFFTKPDFSKYDLVMFDLTGRPKAAELSASVTPTIGDGNLHSELEDNRIFGIEVMEESGINVPEWEAFDDLNEAKRFIRKTNKRYVFKPNGGQEQDTASTYVAKSAEDMLEYLDKLGAESKGVEFILQEVVDGTEISTEAWFNGEEFFLLNSTLEEKKFMDGGRGPNTGCSGNLVWCYDSINAPQIFKEGLGKLKDFLQQYNFRGMVDLNTIVSPTQLYGLEWTPRFGYDATATLFNLISSNLGDFVGEIASGGKPTWELRTRFSAGVRLSIPPYPSEIKGHHSFDVPIKGISPEDVGECFLYDAYLDGEDLLTAGVNGMVAVPMAVGDTIADCFARVKAKIDKIHIPNMQYRGDIEECCIKRYRILSGQGWLN